MRLGKIKDKAKELLNKLVGMGKAALCATVEYTITVVLIGCFAIGAMKLPELHNKYLRSHVGKKVYMIRDSKESGGGTGFAVKAPSGESYILTNDHVCGVSKDGMTVLVTGDDGSMRRRIIAHDENSDLCLVEGMPGVEGLSVASSGPSMGDIIHVVGHPKLQPTHVSSGEVTGKSDISVMLGPISVVDPQTGEEKQIDPAKGGILPSQCAMPKHSIVSADIDLMFFVLKVKFCVETVHDAYETAVEIYPGNSGSPVVNFWGNVIGVAFAGNRDTNWGSMVPIQDVKAFLKNF